MHHQVFPWHHLSQQWHAWQNAQFVQQVSRDRPGCSWIPCWLGTRTAMDTGKQLNANELIAKLQELEKENARLRKILDVHGIPYIVTEPNVTTKESLQAYSIQIQSWVYRKRLRYFVVFFKVVMMSLPSVGTVVRLKSQATNLYARGNGIMIFATSESTNVRTVPTGNLILVIN